MSTNKGRGDINTTGDDIVLKSGETDQVTISAGDNASAATHKTPDNSSVLVGAEHGGDATKKVAIDSSGATTGTKTTLTASQTADRIVYLPDATTTLATTDLAQTITNKTIDADNNFISNLAHGAEVDSPSSGVHGVTGSIVGTSDAQTITNKTIDADNNTISNLAHGAEVDNPSSGVHGVSGSVVGTTDTQTLTNKTLQDSTTSIVDNTDATKVFKFEVSGVTTATTRTATVPDADFTMVGTATTQTITNKTIDGDNNTISNLAHGAEVDNPSSGVHGVTGSVVGTTDTQDLSGKTFTDAVTLQEQVSTPSTPASGDKKLYPKTDGKLYTLDSSGNEIQVGSGVGGGSLNLNINPDAEIAVDNSGTNDIGDYIDSGAGTTASRTTTASEKPLDGFKDTAVKITLATGTNDYTRLRFVVPTGYLNQVLGIGWTQLVSGLSAQNITLELYSYSDSAFSLNETQMTLFGEESGVYYLPIRNGDVRTSFSPNAYQYYELRWINNGGTSGYVSMNSVSIDNGNVQIGPADTEWTSYTPSNTQGLGTITSRLQWRIRGQNVEIQGDFDTGTVAASEAQLELPNSYTVSLQSSTSPVVVGYAHRDTSSAYISATLLATDGDTFLNFAGKFDGTDNNLLSPENGSSIYSNSQRITVFASVPVAELASNYTLTAAEAQEQTSRARFYADNLVLSGTPTIITFNSTDYNTGGGFTYSAGQVTCNFTGYVSVKSGLEAASGSSGVTIITQIYKNTTSVAQNQVKDSAFASVSDDVYVTTGDTIEIRASASGGTPTLATTQDGTYFTLHRIPDRSAQAIGFPINGDTTTGSGDAGLTVKQSATADIGASPSQTDFNNLLQKLRDAGILAT